MIYCLNPSCNQPVNPDGRNFCQSCGKPLIPLLRNRYRIIQPLGGGGFGRTFLAADEDKLQDHCVVKQLAPQIQGTGSLNKATELFHEEAWRLQQLGEHPQIPTLYAYFRQDDYLYLVQQLIVGQSLRQELQQQGTFSEEKIWQLLRDLLPVLKFVHEHQVIHRDIKPDNIMRRAPQASNSPSPVAQQGNLVLIDFGVAKQLTDSSLEYTGTSIGSHGYAPIEQMKYGFAYPASDLFSLGVTCFSLLTGIQPSHLYIEEGYNWVTHWQDHLQSPISAKLQQVLNKLLQKELTYRYQSADEVLEDLQQHSPSPSLPQSTPIKPQRIEIHPKPPVSLQTVIQPEILLPKIHLPIKIILGSVLVFLGFTGYFYFQDLPLRGHSGEVNSLAFRPLPPKSPPQNQIVLGKGNILASGSDDTLVHIWDLQQRKEILTLKGHTGKVYAVAISQDGQTLVSSSDDTTIKIWNLNTGKEIGTLKGHQGLVNSVAISPDGETVVSGSYDGTIKIWDLNTEKEILTLKGHTAEVLSVVISVNGEKIISGSADKTIKIWNLKTGKEILPLSGHLGDVNALAISPNGQLFVSASDDKTVKLWNLNTGKLIRTLKGHKADVNAIAFSPNDNQYIATGSDDKTVKLWNLDTGEEIITWERHSGPVYAVAFSPDGKTLVSGSKDKNIRIWHLPD